MCRERGARMSQASRHTDPLPPTGVQDSRTAGQRALEQAASTELHAVVPTQVSEGPSVSLLVRPAHHN